MRRAPGFWSGDGFLPWLLSPAAGIVARVAARRVARPGFRVPVPVICVGNVTVGGAGKTTVALDLGRRLAARGAEPHFLLRGYGGRVRGVARVVRSHSAREVGDEALLLAEVAPTWVSADRAAGGRAAVAAGAGVIVMDDGLQNPGLVKDLSLLVIDGESGFGNGRVLPAGPLREPAAAAARRCQAAVLIGGDRRGALAQLPDGLPVLRARLVPGAEAGVFAGRRVLGFAGIARPEKFFASLREIGADVVATREFPDHFAFAPRDLESVLNEARRLGAIAVTTAKDAVRVPPGFRGAIEVLTISLQWADEALLESLLPRLA